MNNTVEQGRIYFKDFFKLDRHFFDVLTHNIGELLKFVMPLILFLIAVYVSRTYLGTVKKMARDIQREIQKNFRKKRNSFDSFQEDKNYNKELNRQTRTINFSSYRGRGRRAYNRK